MQKNVKKQRKLRENGITLVALVVTIIVLLILAGVSLSLVLGDNGIITRAQDAVMKYKEATKKENEMLNIAFNTEVYSDKNGDTAIIPKGYSLTEENIVNQGLVIKDVNGNEWVWIPVKDASQLYKEGNYTINSKIGNKYSMLYDYSKRLRIERTNIFPEGDGYREPNFLNTYDLSHYSDAGFGSSEEMTAYFINDYEAMIQSITDNGGFYIGRYELSGTVEEPEVKKGNIPLTNSNWYQLNATCRAFETDSTTSTMMWRYSLECSS